MNQPNARVNQPYTTLRLASALREMFGVQLYKNNARALLSCILSILNLDWLQHARSVREVYEFMVTVHYSLWAKCTQLWPLNVFFSRLTILSVDKNLTTISHLNLQICFSFAKNIILLTETE